jgi:hypothetical protein
VADDAGEVALLFCDINYFDDVIKECQEQIIGILDDTFRAFDSICSNIGIQKIEVEVSKTRRSARPTWLVEASSSSRAV